MTSVVVALADLIGKTFTELEGRAFAVSEVEISKESLPRLPCGMVALKYEAPKSGGRLDAANMTLKESIVVNIMLPPVTYDDKEALGEAIFYAFYDYNLIRDRLLTALSGWKSPQGAALTYEKLEMAADKFAVSLVFSFAHVWNWCPDDPPAACDDVDARKATFRFSVRM